MIEPTVGRVVWFWPEAHQRQSQPLAAIVTYVRTERVVNLAVFNALGFPSAQQNVKLLQDDDAVPAYSHCTWMPYQKGQAARSEALEAGLAEARIAAGTALVPPAAEVGTIG